MILVFGKKGQIATHLDKNSDVICLGRDQCNGFVRGQASKYIKKLEPELIINAAAYTNVINAEKYKEAAFALNSDFPQEIAEASWKNNIPIIHISTDYVYGPSKKEAISENDLCNPINEYGKSKLEGEANIAKVSSRYLILRTSWVFSEYSNNFVKKIIHQVCNNQKSIEVVTDQIGCPSSAKAVADIILRLGEKICKTPNYREIYNYCGYPAVSRFEFAEKIIKELSLDINIRKIKTDKNISPKRQNCSVLDCQKIRRDFDIIQHNWQAELIEVLKNLNG